MTTLQLWQPSAYPTIDYNRSRWADKIKDDLSGAVGGIIQAGADLMVARSELGLSAGSKRDSWVAFLLECGLTESSASKLMKIARSQVLADFSHWEKLPVSWTSLYLLSQVPDDELIAYLESGDVHTRMTREDVERLIKGTGRKHGGKPGEPRPKVKDLQNRIKHLESERDRLQEIITMSDLPDPASDPAQTDNPFAAAGVAIANLNATVTRILSLDYIRPANPDEDPTETLLRDTRMLYTRLHGLEDKIKAAA